MKALYPGAYDPVTTGHLDVVRRAVRLFDELVVGVYDAPPKTLMFNLDERVEMLRTVLQDLPQVEIRPYSGLTVDFAASIGALVIVRGLRIGADFEYEREMALMNRAISPAVESIFLMASLEQQFISSSRVKEIAGLGGDVSRFVPEDVATAIAARLGHR